MKTKMFTFFCGMAASAFIANATTYYERIKGADTNTRTLINKTIISELRNWITIAA